VATVLLPDDEDAETQAEEDEPAETSNPEEKPTAA
jgi:hypothetical protein